MEEITAAAKTLRSPKTMVLSGSQATESAFKQADLQSFGVIHLAVHGFADRANPERAALVLLSDPSKGEDGFLYSSEVVQLRLSASLVVLSACDSAVGPLQGQEGIANLSRAFLLAGAKSVVSTSWPTDDASSSLLMKRFYVHLANRRKPDEALTAAKRDILRKYGKRAVPYHWAGFVIEGGRARTAVQARRNGDNIEQSQESTAGSVQRQKTSHRKSH
jgi:CHAT domain-containing protein